MLPKTYNVNFRIQTWDSSRAVSNRGNKDCAPALKHVPSLREPQIAFRGHCEPRENPLDARYGIVPSTLGKTRESMQIVLDRLRSNWRRWRNHYSSFRVPVSLPVYGEIGTRKGLGHGSLHL